MIEVPDLDALYMSY